MNEQELLSKWGNLHAQDDYIFTWSGRNELLYLAEEASRHADILEVGTNYGRSAKMMLTANPNCHVTCVDHFPWDGIEKTCRYFLREEINEGRCEIIKLRSTLCASVLKADVALGAIPRTFDMIFLDGGHEYDEVIEDIWAWKPLVRKGGILVGHDYKTGAFPGVEKAVRELLPNHYEPVKSMWAVNL